MSANVIGVTPAIDGAAATDGLLVVNTARMIFEVRLIQTRNSHSIRPIGAEPAQFPESFPRCGTRLNFEVS